MFFWSYRVRANHRPSSIIHIPSYHWAAICVRHMGTVLLLLILYYIITIIIIFEDSKTLARSNRTHHDGPACGICANLCIYIVFVNALTRSRLYLSDLQPHDDG